MNKDFLNYIKKRGFVHQCTDESKLNKFLETPSLAYIGFDCTSDSLHAGSLLPLMLLRNFQKFGHKPIILIGGGTTLVGDPSGKDETRKILSEDEINLNKKSLKRVFEKFLSFDKSKKNCALMIDNYDWLSNLKYIDFIRDFGSKFSINKMLSLDSIKQRLKREQNLSFLEFNYSILQAYDFLELFKKYDCRIQFGGSDQWGNIVSGIDLIKRIEQKDVFGLTTPLITTSSGTKMGKTESGAIWLSQEKLDSTSFWQYWRNTTDEDIIKFLFLFSELETKKIEEFKTLSGSDLNNLKITLANEVTKLCHGEEKSRKAEAEAKKILTNDALDSNVIDNCERKLIFKEKNIQSGLSIKEILIGLKLSQSNAESKRLISQGAVKINDEKIKDKELSINKEKFIKHPKKENTYYAIIYVGKNKYGILELIS